jgi:protein tyrosine phosphatase (PTP) superfamily phosphohydrolase (DUF442 family)
VEITNLFTETRIGKTMRTILNLVFVSLIGPALVVVHAETPDASPVKEGVVTAKLGDTKNVHAFGETLLCGQPSTEDFLVAKGRGVEVVITLRKTAEIAWDEERVVKDLGMEFHRIAFGAPPTLTDDVFKKSLALLAANKSKSVMLHCGSANRVGAIWLAHRVLNDGVELQTAREEAKEVGLRTVGYEQRALQFIAKEK